MARNRRSETRATDGDRSQGLGAAGHRVIEHEGRSLHAPIRVLDGDRHASGDRRSRLGRHGHAHDDRRSCDDRAGCGRQPGRASWVSAAVALAAPSIWARAPEVHDEAGQQQADDLWAQQRGGSSYGAWVEHPRLRWVTTTRCRRHAKVSLTTNDLHRLRVDAAGPASLSRRSLLLGGVALVALGSCSAEEPTDIADLEVPAEDGVALVALFAAGSELHLGGEKRLPFALAEADGTLQGEVPDQLVFRADSGGRRALGPTVVPARADGLERPYYAVPFTPERVGLYRFETEVDGAVAEASVNVGPTRSSELRTGRPLPPVFTSTFDNPRGVDPLCTRVPSCPLHDISVRDGLRQSRPLAVLVAAPGACDISYCPPVLELLLEATERHPRIHFLHAEVYVDPQAETNALETGTTDIVQTYGLDHEPALFVADAAGLLRHRLDHIFDRTELEEVLSDVDEP